MKTLIIFTSLVAIALANEGIKKCQKQSGASDALVEKMTVKDFSFDDKQGKCYVKCRCDDTKLCSDNKLNAAALMKKRKLPGLDPSKLLGVQDKCNAKNGSDECDTVFQRVKCFFDMIPALKKPCPNGMIIC